ncbi:MAG: ATP-grasp domain-containing protein [Myxococcota bacterium]
MAERRETPATGAGRAIVTYSRGLHALAVIRSLGRRGVEVIAGDEVAVTPGGMSKYAVDRFTYPNPLTDREGFLAACEDAIARFDPGRPEVPYVLMPVHQETLVVAAEQKRLGARIRLPLAPADAFDLVQHKRRFHEQADARGWPVPHTWRFGSVDEVRAHAPSLPYPVFVKHPIAVSGIGVHMAEGPEALVAIVQELVDEYRLGSDDFPVVQEVAEGEDYCVAALYDHGEARALVSYRNVMRYPREGGPGAIRETVKAPELERIARRILDDVGWHGVAQVDFRWSGEEQDPALVLEVNPRFFGGVQQLIESGVDYPWLLFRLAVDGRVEAPGAIRYDVRTEKPVLGLLATIEEIAESDERMRQAEKAWQQARASLREGHTWPALRSWFTGLRESMDVGGRIEQARKLLLENEENVSLLFDPDDPLPVLGYVYPLALFVRHGRLSQALLSGAEG